MQTTVVIIGAGQAGLAMSHCLTERSIDHVILERGRTAQSWRSDRWDSLRLLTPNWMSRLPGHRYEGLDPDGFMTAPDVTRFLDDYRVRIGAPVIGDTAVRSIDRTSGGFRAITDNGVFRCRCVVIATGACATPRRPAIATQLPLPLHQVGASSYRNPDSIPDGPVLVVGASASGSQIADELARAGRRVTLCVGNHVRLPRSYRGRDIHAWMDAIGLLDERIDDVDDPARASRQPSLQLIGTPERRSLGCNELREQGVELVGRLAGVSERGVQFSGGLANVLESADLKMGRLLDSIDDYIDRSDDSLAAAPPDRPAPTQLPAPRLDLAFAEITTVVWATGFRPRYPWLDSSLLDRKGAIVHDRGVLSEPGMYVLGLPFMRRRKSSFLDGVGADATELASHLHAFLAAHRRAA